MGASRELHYQPRNGVVHYTAYASFAVDGIHYWRNNPRGVYVSRPMIELLTDTDDAGADHFPSDPPTDKELDWFVRTGRLPSI